MGNAFNAAMREVLASPNDLIKWKKLIFLPLIMNTDCPGARMATIKERLLLLDADDWSKFTVGSFVGRLKPIPIHAKPMGEDERRHLRTDKLLKAGEFKRAYMCLMSTAKHAVVDARILETLQRLHPTRTNSHHEEYTCGISDEFRNRLPHHVFDAADVRKVVFSAPRLLASPIDKFSYDYMRQLMGKGDNPVQQEFTRLLTAIIAMHANGAVPHPVSLFYAGPEAMGLETGPKVRPLTLGIPLRSIAAKLLMDTPDCKAGIQSMTNIQKGVGVNNGCEEIIHATNVVTQIKPNLNILLCDEENAFNRIDRVSFLQQVKAKLPSLFPNVNAMYSRESSLSLFSSHNDESVMTIKSSTGSQQGDGMGSLLFSLGLDPFLQRLSSILDHDECLEFLKAYISMILLSP